MDFIPIKTRVFIPPKDDIYDLLDSSLTSLQEKDILVIASKIISIHQGKCIKITQKSKSGPPPMKIELIKKEADSYLKTNPHGLTVKGNTLIPYAGIDRSNGNGYYILWPDQPSFSARKIWEYLTQKYQLKELGIIISDSCLLPMRLGVSGISIGFFGFHPLKTYAGEHDIFGISINACINTDLADSLAATATAVMGEGGEQTPLLLIKGVDLIAFTDKDTWNEILMPAEKDLFIPLLALFNNQEK